MENLCETILYQALLLRHDLRSIPALPLPRGYAFRFYQAGDEENWLAIESSAREFLCPELGRESWRKYFSGHEEELKRRMLFVTDEAGQAVATASAYFDQQEAGAGFLHWVAVRREHQGRGISKPLVYRALSLLADMGYPYACVPTQTNTWLAVKIYLDCGFMPYRGSKLGYSIIRTLTGHEKLKDYPLLAMQEIFDPVCLHLEE